MREQQMDFFLNFRNSLHTVAYSSHLTSHWPSWALTFKCSVFLILLSSFFHLILSLQSEIPLLAHYNQSQAIFGFALFVLGISFIILSKWKIKISSFRSFLTAFFLLSNIVISTEIFLIFREDLTPEDRLASTFALISYRILPSIPLILLSHSWILRSFLILIIITYGLLRTGPVFMIGYNVVFAISTVAIVCYIFYREEKSQKDKFLMKYSDEHSDKLAKQLIHSVPEGIMIINSSNKPIFVNQYMAKVLGTDENEEAVVRKATDLKLDYVINEVKKYLENPQIDASYMNCSPGKMLSPHESTPATPLDSIKMNFDRFPGSMTKLVMKPKISKSGVSIPSIYLDDLKYRRKVTRKHSSKDYSDDFKFKEGSIFLDCLSPVQAMNKSRSAINIGNPVESGFRLRVEGEKFKGYVTNPVKEGEFITFNLSEETGSPLNARRVDLMIEPDYLVYEVKYKEVTMDKEDYKFFFMTDVSKKQKQTEDSSKYKKLMFSSISHEFRTPVNGILGLLELASKECERGLKTTHIKPALHSAHMLMFLIDDMLDYSKILSDELHLHLDTFSVRDCLEEVKNLMYEQAQIKDLDLQVIVRRSTPKHIKSDKKRIQQVLINLLSNAVKFTNQEGSIEVIAEGVTYSSHCLKISVRDTGIGLNSSDRERLHLNMNDGNIYRKVSTSSSGAGIGLMITQSLALALGPNEEIAPGVAGITVESQYGEGSIFQFVVYNQEILGTLDEIITIETLPEERHPAKKSTIITTIFDPKSSMSHPNFVSTANYISAQRSIPNLGKRFSKGDACGCNKILIVDDNSYNIFALKALLNSFGLQCDSVYDGKEACKMVTTAYAKRRSCCGGYRLVFMDCNMPIMSGFDATRELKAKMDAKEINHVPIAGWTAYTDKGSLEEGIGAGMDEFITKPVTIKVLADVLRKYELSQEE